MFSVFKPSAFLEAKHVYVTPMLVDTCRDTLQGLHQTVWSALFRTSIVLRVARHLPRCPWSAQQCLPALLNSHTAHSVSDSVSDGIGCSLKRGYLGYCLVLVGFCFFGVVFGFRFFDCKGCTYATADPPTMTCISSPSRPHLFDSSVYARANFHFQIFNYFYFLDF